MQLLLDSDNLTAYATGIFVPEEFAILMDEIPLDYTVWIDPATVEALLEWTRRLVQYDIRLVWVTTPIPGGYITEQKEKWFQYLLPLPEGSERPVWVPPEPVVIDPPIAEPVDPPVQPEAKVDDPPEESQ